MADEKIVEETTMMRYRTLKRMMEKGMTEGLEDKLDIFFATGKITQAQSRI